MTEFIRKYTAIVEVLYWLNLISEPEYKWSMVYHLEYQSPLLHKHIFDDDVYLYCAE